MNSKTFDEIITNIDKMIQPNRKNPFPDKSFLIENRAYFDTSNFLIELRERIEKKTKEHLIDLKSIEFNFK